MFILAWHPAMQVMYKFVLVHALFDNISSQLASAKMRIYIDNVLRIVLGVIAWPGAPQCANGHCSS
jgi:hypothetical protein